MCRVISRNGFSRTERARHVLKTVTWCLSLLTCVLFLYHGAKYSVWLYGTGERTTGLWWPRITSVGSMFFGALFMTLYSLTNVLKHLEGACAGTRHTRPGGES